MKKSVAVGIAALMALSMLAFGACGKPEEKGPAELSSEEMPSYANFYGRYIYDEIDSGDTTQTGYRFFNSASGFEFSFHGTSLSVVWQSEFPSYRQNVFSVFVDGDTDSESLVLDLVGTVSPHRRMIVEDLPEDDHTVKILKRHASSKNNIMLISAETDGYFLPPPPRPALRLDVYGDSITCGEGTDRVFNDQGVLIDSYNALTENVFHSYAGYAAKFLDAELQILGRGGAALKYTSNDCCIYDNYLSADMDVPASAFPNYVWDYGNFMADAVVIYLGTNDDYGPGFTAAGFREYMVRFIREAIGENYGNDIPIFLLSGMMTTASSFGITLRNVKSDLSEEFPNLQTIEYLPTTYGHPIAPEHEAAGRRLAVAIADLFGMTI